MKTTTKLLSALINILVGLVALLVILIRQDWFGSGDTTSYLFWTFPLAIGLAFSGQYFLVVLPNKKVYRIILILLISLVVPFSWFWIMYLILGPWVKTISFPIFQLWATATIFQLFLLDWRLPINQVDKPLKNILRGLLIFPLAAIGSLIILFGFSYFESYLNKPKPETYLIPDQLKGPFKIVYGEKCGTLPDIVNGRRILKIPENGVLIIQPEFQAGLIDHEYYLVDDAGHKTKIDQFENYVTGKKSIPGVVLSGSGNYAGEVENGTSSSSPLTIHFTDFELKHDTTDTFDFREKNRMDSLTIRLVEDCRNSWK